MTRLVLVLVLALVGPFGGAALGQVMSLGWDTWSTRIVDETYALVWDALPSCPTEDSDWCKWDATQQGNGKGNSFFVIGDHVFVQIVE